MSTTTAAFLVAILAFAVFGVAILASLLPTLLRIGHGFPL